ncbi:MAG: hypothetical protein KJ732_01420, partial [Candidatus Margulisbacteria bacterium]|nr:hypothetical protein [Candidatus Margulisiibacteriota bacterium]
MVAGKTAIARRVLPSVRLVPRFMAKWAAESLISDNHIPGQVERARRINPQDALPTDNGARLRQELEEVTTGDLAITDKEIDRIVTEREGLTFEVEQRKEDTLRTAFGWRLATAIAGGGGEQAELLLNSSEMGDLFPGYRVVSLYSETPFSRIPDRTILWPFQPLISIELCLRRVSPDLPGTVYSHESGIDVPTIRTELGTFLEVLRADIIRTRFFSQLTFLAQLECEDLGQALFQSEANVLFTLLISSVRLGSIDPLSGYTYKFEAEVARIDWARENELLEDNYPTNHLEEPAQARSFIESLTWRPA